MKWLMFGAFAVVVVAVYFASRPTPDHFRVKSSQPIRVNEWQHVAITYDGSSRAAGVRIYIDGGPVPTLVDYDQLQGTIRCDQPFRIGRRSDSLGFVGLVDEICVYDRALVAEEVRQWAEDEDLRAILERNDTQRTAPQQERLLRYFLNANSPEWRGISTRGLVQSCAVRILETV